MNGICLTCGIYADLEAHHVAGRHNNMQLTVLVCLECHRTLTRWQYAAGIDLKERSPRTELDALRTVAVGATHVLRLYAERRGQASPIPASLAVHTARAISRLMDQRRRPGSARSVAAGPAGATDGCRTGRSTGRGPAANRRARRPRPRADWPAG